MDFKNDDSSLEPRTPTVDDLVALCRELNNVGAQYVVVGGMAIIQLGFTRATEDIDFVVENSPENQEKVKRALLILPDKAVKEIQYDDLREYVVIKVADEIIVDLMTKACGIDYHEAKNSIQVVTINGVEIPFASAELLWKMKQTMREKDNLDLAFLKELLKK